MGKVTLFLTVVSLSTLSSCHVVLTDSSQLQPVQGLYIKPSADGTTGDLFVAATEDSGTKSQWLTDQPISFLPAASQLQPTAALPVTLASSLPKTSSQEETATPKLATTTPAISPINYAYALPFPTSDGKVLAPCPYAAAANGDGVTKWPEGTAPQYSTAFQYFYPQMVAAMSRAMNTFAGAAEAKDKAAAALSVPPYWPQTYTYPYQYLMVDPNAWAQTQKEAASKIQAEASSDESSS